MNVTISSFSKNFQTQFTDFFSQSTIPLTAYLTGFFKRSTKRVTPQDILKMMIITSFRSKASSLLDMTSTLKELNSLIKIKPQSLSQRINSLGCRLFFRAILEYTLEAKIKALSVEKTLPHLLNTFKKVLIEDSSKIELAEKLQEEFKGQGGNASLSALKMHTVYDISSNRFLILDEYSGTTSDTVLSEKTLEIIQENDLLLRDMGFFSIDALQKIETKSALYLSRLPSKVNIYLSPNDEKPTSFKQLFKKYSKKKKLDKPIYIGEDRFPVRLVAFKVPKKIAKDREISLNKVAKHRERKSKQETLERLGFTLFITNVQADIWPLEVIEIIYRLRWQIELIYLSWKSQLKIDYLQGTNENRIRSLLYAKWLAIIVCCTIYELVVWYAQEKLSKEASFYKLVNWFLLSNNFEKLIKEGLTKNTLKRLLNDLEEGWCKDKRKKRISTMQQIRERKPLYVKEQSIMEIKKLVT